MRSFRVGRILGIEVFADPSLLILVALLAWSLFLRFDEVYQDTPTRLLGALAICGGVLFLMSVLAHELSHSVVARRRGLAVRRIRLFIFGGASEIEEEARSPGEEFAVAFAGPLASLVIGGSLLAGAWPFSGAIPSMVRLVGLMNLLLAVFNLLPGLPLDGGRVLHAILWKIRGDRAAATGAAVASGRALGMLLMGAGVVMLVISTDLAGIWMVAVGWFLSRAAAASLVRERVVERVGALTVAEVMRPIAESASGDLTVDRVLELYGWGERMRALPVTVHGRVRGIIGNHEIAAVAPPARSTTLVADAMTVIGPTDVVDADEPVMEFLARDAGPARRVLVARAGRVVGIVTGDELAHLFE